MRSSDQEDGFTLVELLIVTILIGILSAIAIPSFLHVKDRGYQAAMTTDLHNAVTAETTWSLSHTAYTADPTDLVTEGYRTTSGVTPVHVKLVGGSFVACVKHASAASWLVYDGTSGATTRSASDCA